MISNGHRDQVPAYVAKQFDMSKRAALIRLEKLNAIIDKNCA